MALAVGLLLTGIPDVSAQMGSRCAWAVVPQAAAVAHPEKFAPVGPYGPRADRDTLEAVATVSKNDVWAVGSYRWPDGDRADAPLLEHWDGHQWRAVPSNGPKYSSLFGVDGIAANDVWVVGQWQKNGDDGPQNPLIEHWDGKAWSVVPSRGPTGSDLQAVAAVAANDAWAVGGSDSGAVTEHWDGSQWHVVPSPDSSDSLSSVSAASSSDVWAVSGPYFGQGIVEHWDGRVWKSYGQTVGQGVSALSRRDAWAAGTVGNGSNEQGNIEHWNGRRWKAVPTPTTPSLNSVVALSATNAWAVGDGVLHWNGKRWSLVHAPDTYLKGIAAVSPKDIWAVGGLNLGESLHYTCAPQRAD